MTTRLKCLKPRLATTTAKPLWSPDEKRGNRHQRGYGYAWEKLREVIIDRDNGLCQPCYRKARVTIFHAIDHITNKAKARANGWTTEQIEAPSNLECICKPCHDEKSRREMSEHRGGV